MTSKVLTVCQQLMLTAFRYPEAVDNISTSTLVFVHCLHHAVVFGYLLCVYVFDASVFVHICMCFYLARVWCYVSMDLQYYCIADNGQVH